MKNYRPAFLAAVTVNVLLGAVLGGLWWSHRRPPLALSAPAAATTTAAAVPPPHDGAAAAAPPALSPVQLGPERLQRIGVTTAVAAEQTVTQDIRTTGNVDVDQQRLSSVQLRFPGWIQKVFVNSLYQYVRKGQPLFTIYSPEVVTTEHEYLLARHTRTLLADSAVPGVSAGTVSLLAAARERLEQWDVPAAEIGRLDRTGTIQRDLEVDSPASGYVTEWRALPQTYAEPQTPLYTLADLSTVWVYAQVFQNDIGRVRVGMPASVTVDTYPGRTFRGRVDDIWPQVDEGTRTVKVRLAFPNPHLTLMPGMFVNVDISVPLGRRLVVPASAIFETGTRALVFVDHGGGDLEPRTIQAGATAGDEAVVASGLKPGERVVTSANFLIDSESQLQAALGSFAPPPPGAGAAASMNGSSRTAKVAITTDPSPPRKGDNTVRVGLTDAGGRPVTGAVVDVTFFMPAMPAMGMPAAHARATLHETAPGQYEGPAQLPSGGQWQVIVTARRDGAVIASRHLTISTTGGA